MPKLKNLHIGGLLSPIPNKGLKRYFSNPTNTMISALLKEFTQPLFQINLSESALLTD